MNVGQALLLLSGLVPAAAIAAALVLAPWLPDERDDRLG